MRLAYKLAVKIFNLFNFINHNNFNVTEKHESIKFNLACLLVNKVELVDMLRNEILDSDNTNDTAKQLLQEVISF
jgi:hypothetical protein